ncbi:MAG TPA: thiamine-phosphate kinase, partial [Methylophilaceae bacterium]|nr:thiamine-phosphate kinase [Methylophilaceae bacterium]
SSTVNARLTDAQVQRMVLAGGDDYELCFTAPSRNHGEIARLAQMLALPLTRIGSVGENKGLIVRGLDNEILDMKDTGFDHFA